MIFAATSCSLLDMTQKNLKQIEDRAAPVGAGASDVAFRAFAERKGRAARNGFQNRRAMPSFGKALAKAARAGQIGHRRRRMVRDFRRGISSLMILARGRLARWASCSRHAATPRTARRLGLSVLSLSRFQMS